ncbi:MAG: choice-of-anchor D domain-containing protein, partial [Deltaproteobacteria bacterium]|nr:choice-of-anchor D domain-containing protein [Deltaproteobacteria bacterium]
SATGPRTGSVSIANDDGDENPYNFSIQGTGTVAPEMGVEGNSQEIADGDTTPTTIDHTDFGGADILTGMVVRTFTILNTGTGDLNLAGTPLVEVGGTHAGDFSVTTMPGSPVTPGGDTLFQVTFNPGALGLRSATISIENDDGDENPYNFSIQGTGTAAPEMRVEGNSQEIADGDDTPSSDDHTHLGRTDVSGSPVVRSFTILNTGSADLNLTGTPLVEVGGAHAGDFTVTALPATPVAPGGDTLFEVTFNPAAQGVRSAFISIANDDADENPYNFAISGTGNSDELAVSFEGGGLWHYDHSDRTWTAIAGPADDLENFEGDLAADFGAKGLWLYDGDWAGLGGNPEAMEACGGNMYADFGANGLWQYDGSWSGIGSDPGDMLCCGEDLYVDFGASGLWVYDGSWSALAGDPNGMWCANGVFYANLGGYLWQYDGSWDVIGGVAEAVEGCGSDLYVDISGGGLWQYDGAWSGIAGDPQAMECCGGDLYVDYGANGLWRYDGTWVGVAGDPEDMLCGDPQYGDALYVDFAGGGLWRYDGTWMGLGGDTTVMTVVDINLSSTTCDNDGICEPWNGENPTNCPGDC